MRLSFYTFKEGLLALSCFGYLGSALLADSVLDASSLRTYQDFAPFGFLGLLTLLCLVVNPMYRMFKRL